MNQRGVTLVEMMIATAVIAVAAVGLLGAFVSVQKGIQASKNKTLASNLVQEKMQIIEQQSYFRVLPTLSPSFLADGTPYDAAAFPPESVLEGGMAFTRYTYVQVVTENRGALNILPPTTPDTGMRQITETVQWLERGKMRSLSINSIMSNPNTIEANSVFTGAVRDSATNQPIAGALVNVAENVGWRDATNGGGGYSIHLSPGSYNLSASAQGYFPQFSYLSIGPTNTVTQNFSLVKMSSGGVSGNAWVNPRIVISQVVSSTVQAGGFDAEYIELFNPTKSAVAISGGINLNIVSGNNNLQCVSVPLTYVNAAIQPNHYYLIANTNTFTVNGSSWNAAGFPGQVDAYYADSANSACNTPPPGWSPPSARPLLQRGHSNTVYLTDSLGNIIDAAGWTNNGATHAPSYCLGTCIPMPPGGLPAGQQIVRTSSPSFIDAGFSGRDYDSGSNAVDFAYPGNPSGWLATSGIPYQPFSGNQSSATVIAGVPAIGAVVSATDGLSSPAKAVSAGTPPVAAFALTDVATGTWTVLITSASYELENDTVTISASGSVVLFPSSTTILEGSASAGFISGSVVDGFGAPISAPSSILVTAAGETVAVDPSTGRYTLRVSSGSLDVTANPGFANPYYVAITSAAVPVQLGQVSDGVNFVLTQGGRISGWITRDGINGLQGVTVVVTDVNGNAQDQEVSDVNGNFKTVNIATGAYTVGIPLDTTEVSSPTIAAASVVLGATVSVGTFTITGALGAITGNVTASGSPISSGVLIVATTSTLVSPPVISSLTLASAAYYITSSLENGTFSLSVRQSTSPAYNLYGWYSKVDAAGNVSIQSKSLANISVTAGQTVPGKNLAW